MLVQDGYDSEETKFNAFQIAGNNVHLSGLTFRGSLDTPAWTNGQGAAVEITNGRQFVTVDNCHFENLRGFSVHSFGGYQHVVTDCTFDTCGNGLNVNAASSYLANLTFDDSEGIEASGAYTVIEDVSITNALAVGVSLGGDMSGSYLPGIILRRFTINGVTQSSANGVVIADGCDGTLVEDGDIRLTRGTGIVTTVSSSGRARDNIVRRCTLQDNANIGVYLSHDADLTGTTVEACVVLPNASADPDYATNFGIRCAEPNAVIRDNDVRGAGVLFDLSYAETAIGATNEDNLYDTLQDERP